VEGGRGRVEGGLGRGRGIQAASLVKTLACLKDSEVIGSMKSTETHKIKDTQTRGGESGKVDKIATQRNHKP